MALTVTPTRSPRVPGDRKIADVTVAFDSSYPTGGEDFDADDCGLSEILHVAPVLAEGYFVQYNASTGKLQVFYSDNNNAADGPLIEVANAADLSGLDTVALRVEGY